MTETKTPVTIFTSSGFFGVHKEEAWLLEHGTRPYAQYPAAPFVKFVPKGKRKPTGWIGTYKPYCVILAGHGLPVDPGSPFDPVESTTPGVACTASRYSSCDDRYATDFNAQLNKFLAEYPETLVADYRWTKDITQ